MSAGRGSARGKTRGENACRRDRTAAFSGALCCSLRVLLFAECVATLPASNQPWSAAPRTLPAFTPSILHSAALSAISGDARKRGATLPAAACSPFRPAAACLHTSPQCRPRAAPLRMDSGEGRVDKRGGKKPPPPPPVSSPPAAQLTPQLTRAKSQPSSKASRDSYFLDGLTDAQSPLVPPPEYDWSLSLTP